jgi:hypothetical protein
MCCSAQNFSKTCRLTCNRRNPDSCHTNKYTYYFKRKTSGPWIRSPQWISDTRASVKEIMYSDLWVLLRVVHPTDPRQQATKLTEIALHMSCLLHVRCSFRNTIYEHVYCLWSLRTKLENTPEPCSLFLSNLEENILKVLRINFLLCR